MRRTNNKVIRFFDRLTDDQIEDLLARLDRQMAVTGIAGGPMRDVFKEFVRHIPASEAA